MTVQAASGKTSVFAVSTPFETVSIFEYIFATSSMILSAVAEAQAPPVVSSETSALLRNPVAMPWSGAPMAATSSRISSIARRAALALRVCRGLPAMAASRISIM